MFNTIITTVKTLLRLPARGFWGALFPIALSTMFMFMFANLSSDGTVDSVPVAIVADEAWDASTFKNVAASLAKEDDDQLLEIHECDDAAAANRALKPARSRASIRSTMRARPNSRCYRVTTAHVPHRCSPTAASWRRWQARIRKMPSSCARLPRTIRRRSPTRRRLRAPCRSRAAPAA